MPYRLVYVPVPKDLSKVRTKIILNLTLRQIICFVLAAVVEFPFYFLTKGTIGVDVAATIMIVLMLPFFLLALYVLQFHINNSNHEAVSRSVVFI